MHDVAIDHGETTESVAKHCCQLCLPDAALCQGGDNGDNLEQWPPLQMLEHHQNMGTKLSQVHSSSDSLA